MSLLISGQPKITIITVVYNGASALEKTIQSVLKLPYANIDFIVIDGASVDGTVSIIKKYSNHIKYWISEPDKGIYDAMNKGWVMADDNSYIVFLGAGDYLENLPEIKDYDSTDIIYGKVNIGNKYIFDTKVDFRIRLINSVHHQALLIKKKIHLQPPFSLKYPVFADFDFNQRLYKSGFKFIKDPSFIAYAMEGGVSSRENKSEMLEIVKSNYGRLYLMFAKKYYMFQKLRNKLVGFKV